MKNKRCSVCGKVFHPSPAHITECSYICRKRKYRKDVDLNCKKSAKLRKEIIEGIR